jgi:hemerythrin-like domain-containing protein
MTVFLSLMAAKVVSSAEQNEIIPEFELIEPEVAGQDVHEGYMTLARRPEKETIHGDSL